MIEKISIAIADLFSQICCANSSIGLKLLEERGETKFQANPKMAQAVEIRKSFMKLGAAVKDGVRDGDEATVKRIGEIINQARRDIYSILAE